MADSLAAIVLAAGAGSRLRPLSRFLPKPLCPVAGVPLVDTNLARVAAVVGEGAEVLAVNVHHHAARLAAHLTGRVHLSVEQPEALGTAGAVAHLRPWLAGRPVLVVNGDTWSTIPLGPLVEGWDSERVRVLVAGPPRLVDGVGILGSLLPPAMVAELPHRPAGLYEVCWKPLLADGRLEVVGAEGEVVACDTPADYLRANLLASGGESVVGAGARVDGTLVRSVVWPGATVHAAETLVDAIRLDARTTVLVR